jgi:NTP pyrophosphatase (non-canonical NTP hydrolase)
MTHEIIHERRGECEVKRFAEAMIEKLNEPKNLAKSDWKGLDMPYLFSRLDEEVYELQNALCKPISKCVSSKAKKIEILKECADVANFAMMIADKVGALE